MKFRVLLLTLCAFAPMRLTAQQQNPEPDSKQEGLAVWARLKLMNQSEFQELMAKAQSGDAAAQYQVGGAYDMGKHVLKNSNEAGKWWLKAAEQGYAPAEGAYGMSMKGSNPAIAEHWMLLAAEHGDATIQFWLGVAYEDDWFGTTDAELALKWYRRAADGGDPDAQVMLGQKYADGDGVEQNYGLAAKWFRKAAEHFPDLGGAGQGRNHLGLLYMEGLGVRRDYAQAYFWFSLNGSEGNTEDAKAHLSPEQIRRVDESVQEWKAQHRVNPEVAAALQISN